MPVGLETYDMSGNLIFGVTDSAAKYIGQQALAATGASSSSGSVTDSRFSLGTLWWLTTLPPTTEYNRDVVVTLSGTTLSWTVGPNTPACTLFYGVY